MTGRRDTSKYAFKVGKRIVHNGITNDLGRRETEHRASRKSWANGHIIQLGNKTTRSAGLVWESGRNKTVTPLRKRVRVKSARRIYGLTLGTRVGVTSKKNARKAAPRKTYRK